MRGEDVSRWGEDASHSGVWAVPIGSREQPNLGPWVEQLHELVRDLQETHPDGPEGGRWLWWKNKRHKVPKGTVYRLLAHMWGRDSASYDSLVKDEVFDSAVAPQTVRSYANKANNALPRGFPWRLSADSVNRQLTRVPAAEGS
jgi:hypothetical protein